MSITALNDQFETILNDVNEISKMCINIATSTEEQSVVAKEINTNINNISDAGEQTLVATQASSKGNVALIEITNNLTSLMEQFKGK